MAKFGYTLSSEEHGPQFLIDNAARAEQAGFDFVGISDHFHPWAEKQGQSPFSWSVVGGISQRTSQIEVLMEVVCPIMRYHPAIVAQAAATCAKLLEGRFSLGVGTGEALNEHVVGEGWPHINVRQQMLEEAVQIIRQLWQGRTVDHYGEFFTVEAAKLYTLPRQTPPIIVSAFGPKAAQLAARIGDGLVSVAPNKQLVDQYRSEGGSDKPRYAQIDVCYCDDKDEARRIAFEFWPNAGVKGQLASELRLPAYFEQAAGMTDAESGTQSMVLGADAEEYLEEAQKYLDAGYDHVYFHQIGPDQESFLEFAESELLPRLASKTIATERELAFRERLDKDEEQ
jgi:coenzyme F420-dependent glucose-6-phosphate dehydrogenase